MIAREELGDVPADEKKKTEMAVFGMALHANNFCKEWV